jgi:hypothetical protein
MRMTSLTYDDEHHRIPTAGVRAPWKRSEPHSSGLEHTAFTFTTLGDLALAY